MPELHVWQEIRRNDRQTLLFGALISACFHFVILHIHVSQAQPHLLRRSSPKAVRIYRYTPPRQAVSRPPPKVVLKKRSGPPRPIPDPSPTTPEPPRAPRAAPEFIAEAISLPEPDLSGFQPPAPPEPNLPKRIGPDGIQPQIIRQIEPVYPVTAIRARIDGYVILEVVVRKDGTVGRIKVLSSKHAILENAALEAVRKWRFQPGSIRGEPVDALMSLTVTFTLNR